MKQKKKIKIVHIHRPPKKVKRQREKLVHTQFAAKRFECVRAVELSIMWLMTPLCAWRYFTFVKYFKSHGDSLHVFSRFFSRMMIFFSAIVTNRRERRWFSGEKCLHVKFRTMGRNVINLPRSVFPDVWEMNFHESRAGSVSRCNRYVRHRRARLSLFINLINGDSAIFFAEWKRQNQAMSSSSRWWNGDKNQFH